MNLKKYYFNYALTFFCLFIAGVVTAQKSELKKPNVLVIYTDDHRFSGIHALMGMPVKTPNMDSMVSNGITFTNTYLMGAFSGATCIPSRAMLLSGKQLFNLTNTGHTIPKEDITMGEACSQAGYNTFMVGKWHQDNASLSRSFDSGGTIMGRGIYLTDHFRMPLWDWDKTGKFSAKDAYLLAYNKAGKVMRRSITKDDQKGPIGTEMDGPHTSEIFAKSAIDYINRYQKKEPFFMYLAFHAPHDPRQAPRIYRDMYPANEIELTPSYMPEHPFDNGDMVLRDEALAAWPRTQQVAKQQLSDYYAIITHLDTQIGKVVAALKANGTYDNTLIVLAGDSGLAVGNHGLMGKQNVYNEDGIHVPFILSGGAVKKKGVRIDALSYIHDIFPTICELVGIPVPASIDGKSLVPIIQGKVSEIHPYIYHAYKQFQRAYRKGNYKLIEYVRAKAIDKKTGEFEAGSRVTQLYNIEKDPWEAFNLAIFPEEKTRLHQMQKEMKEAAKTLGDNKEQLNYPIDFWDFY